MTALVTLTSDFGLADAYVGVMKGVILGIAPEARLVDISHSLPAQDILAGAFLLAASWRYFPSGAVHLAVVDPGVGSDRRAIALSIDDAYFVGPDNGLFGLVWAAARRPRRARAVHLTQPAYWLAEPSATFHGRDIFAPVAAHLARGVALDELGAPLPIADLVRLPLPAVRQTQRGLAGSVIHIDHFGNLITNVRAHQVAGIQAATVDIAGKSAPLVRTYGDMAQGGLLALVGSSGFVEVAVAGGNAAQRLGVERGEPILLRNGILAQ